MKERIAIVTGGANGIGAATAQRLAEDGLHVFVADVAVEVGDELCASIRADGQHATFVESDLFAAGSPEATVGQILAHTDGSLDVLVNNAFAYERGGELADVTPESLGADLDQLVISYHSMIRASRHALARSETAAIVNLASVRGFYTGVGFGPYSIAKAAVAQLTRVYAHELGGEGIRVNAVAPGVIGTARTMAQPQRNRDRIASYTPLGRIGRPDDVARAIAFLASPAADYITGQVLGIDGGLTLPLHTDSVKLGIAFEAESD
ncbi:MAG TPA: SDR family NAD(P)-dependent oxidoreductase [Acidimicrobiia bacterium]|nr:SDR family NAD(P)-dependent oxidoreductase [Acidimicrobiia bacterium]